MNKKFSFGILSLFVFSIFLFWACYKRIIHTYLEDDLLWCLPLISQLREKLSWGQMIQAFHSGELSLFDGSYFSTMLSIFGLKLSFYVMVMLFIHLSTAVFLFYLLFKRLRLSWQVSLSSMLIYLSFYPHFHAYIRPISVSHLFAVFMILLILNFYMKTNELMENKKNYKVFYFLTLLISLSACFMRLSISIAPVIIIGHILFTSKEFVELKLKITRWTPVIFILTIYQVILIAVIGRQGSTLDKLLGPAHQIFSQNNIFLVLISYGFILFFFLKFVSLLFRRRNEFYRWPFLFRFFLYLALVTPYVALCLFQWLGCYFSAVSYDSDLRWQQMFYPTGWAFVFFFLLSAWIIFSFIRYLINRNRHLIIFAVWYLSLIPFLEIGGESIASRYLIYLSPIFALMVSLFVFEILPQQFSLRADKNFNRFAMVIIFLVGIMNIYSIHLRLERTILGDYKWSYDYIKISHLIKNDLKLKNIPKGQKIAICIDGLEKPPFIENWKEGFLGQDFNVYDPFILTFKSIIHWKDVGVIVNASCLANSFYYRITKESVVDRQGQSIEPFYQLFKAGLESLRIEDFKVAQENFQKAVYSPPFVIDLLMDQGETNNTNFLNKLIYFSKIIWQSYARDYPGEEKLREIDYMIQKESLDYGMALVLLSYLELNDEPSLSKVYREGANHFLSQREIKEYPLSDIFSDVSLEDFQQFIQTYFFSDNRNNIGLATKVETYKDFFIYWNRGYYFAISREWPYFDLLRFKRGEYKEAYYAKSKYEIRQMISNGQKAISQLDATASLGPMRLQKKYTNSEFFKEFQYTIELNSIPLGHAFLKITPDPADKDQWQATFKILPFSFIQKLSNGKAGIVFSSLINNKNLLPVEFEQQTMYGIQKGKKGKRIIYHHDDLFMERKIYKEDIFSDTRDPVSLLVWLSFQNYEEPGPIKSTMNIERDFYVAQGRVKEKTAVSPGPLKICLEVSLNKINQEYKVLKVIPLEVNFIKKDGWSPPTDIHLHFGILRGSLKLKQTER